MTTTVTLTEASEPRLTFRKGDLVRCIYAPPNNYIVMVTRTVKPTETTFQGVVVSPSTRVDLGLGLFDNNFAVNAFAPFYGTIELQSS